jgi:Bacterial Alpha-2-macroglobulin MG10 domain/Alpha-2-macroglobulin family/MG2 domain
MLLSKRIITAFICLLLSVCIMAQKKTNPYDSWWKKIDALVEKKGLTKSALAEVEKLAVLAKKEKQDAQLIKALLYKIALKQGLEENSDIRSIAALEAEIKSSNQPVTSLLQSVLADKYYQYFQQHRWQLYDRSRTVNFKKDDIATWDADDLHKKISDLYLQSIKEEKTLQQTKLEPFDPIIVKGNARNLRPTLYDLLAFKALEYFDNDERDVTKPAYAFEIKEELYFADAASFSKAKIITKDSSSLHHKALLVYQRLLAFHSEDNQPDALIDADIHRIEFVHGKAVMENKDALYISALQQIARKYGSSGIAAQASYLVAKWQADKASDYTPNKPGSEEKKEAYLKAMVICKKVLEQKVESEGKVNCYNLVREIEKKELELSTEKVNSPDLAFRTLVRYRNFQQIHLRLVVVTEEIRKKLKNRNEDDAYWKNLVNLKIMRGWKQALPLTNDYHNHRAEIKIDPLPSGEYLLLASESADFSLEKNPLAVQFFYVSNISYVSNAQEYFVLHRETGQPLSKASVQVWNNVYDYSKREYIDKKREQLVTDKNGYFKLSSSRSNEERNIRLEISYEKDRLFMDDQQYLYYEATNTAIAIKDAISYEKQMARIFFFTDRSIYRPGQTIFFKGIAITNDMETKKPKVYGGKKSTVTLYNANGEKVDSLELETNDYGSYSGKFKLPEGVLNGQFYLMDGLTNKAHYFSVEEYKRPKFFVAYEPVKGSYKVNDSITLTGMAKAYAGNNIDGATVKYRVVRTPRFIYSWRWSRWGMPATSALEITNGTVSTDGEGKFKIIFKAIPDLTISKDMDPVFDYKVIADVTDINGETRSGETMVPVSYKALLLSIGLSNESALPADSLKQLFVSTTNINGSFEPALVKLAIHKLEGPAQLLRERFWQQPDQFILSKEEYNKHFPYDEYNNESDKSNWTRAAAAWNKQDSTKEGKAFPVEGTKLAEGWYVVEASAKDKFGNEVKDLKYIQLYDEKGKTLPGSQYEWYTHKKTSIEPGEQSELTVASSAKEVFVIQQIEKQSALEQKTATYNFITIYNEKKNFIFPATEADRGGFGVAHFFVKHNRFYSHYQNISVPWTNKELSISYETFRDKTLPGSEEKWKLKITGYKKDKIAAEMLASMYDASLDQFQPHDWNVPGIWPSFYSNKRWGGGICFAEVQSEEKYWSEDGKEFKKDYDQLFERDEYRVVSGLYARGGNLKPEMAMMKSVQIAADAAPAPKSAKKSEEMFVQGEKIKKNGANKLVYDYEKSNDDIDLINDKSKTDNLSSPQIRKNFNETAFFIPDLKTDSAGNISFGFTIPEALTKWKFQALTHTKDLAFGYSLNNVVTQKPLMVQPNAPRFLREGDKMELSAKVVNLTDKELTGTVQLELINAATGVSVDGWFRNMNPVQYFTADAGKSSPVNFIIDVPYQYNSALVYRFVAKAGNNGDGEEASMPVLTNSMLVTESIPLNMRGDGSKSFRLDKLINAGASETLQHHALTVEFTTNPSWYAVQALPYLMEYPYDCAEQTFNRYYANALATSIANASPKLKEVFEKWKTKDTAALLSNLQKNQELKAVLLEETPWVLEAKNEARQKRNIALLFDMLRMSKELGSAFEKLKQLQGPNGGFTWFKGGPDDRYMTQYIITGIGHLKKLNALSKAQQADWKAVLDKAIPYLDARLKEDYDYLVKKKIKLTQNNLSYIQIQYLYMRSFFPDYGVAGNSFDAVNYYRKQTQQYWLAQSRYMQAMIAVSLHRSGDKQNAANIIKSLQENSITNEEMGMYWKDNTGGYYWHQAPVETQSLLIEAFSEITNNTKTVDDLKTWLLKQKQTQNWKTTKATADACYALLLQGSNWLSNTPTVEIKLGDKTVSSTTTGTEAGTGYFKKTFEGSFVNGNMGNINVTVTNSSPAGGSREGTSWGAVYWQYFEHLDKITYAATPLKLEKKLFVEKNTDKGPVLQPVNEGDFIKIGDKIKVRIELRVDRDMEYVHMKDMRASSLEPVNVLSGYKWQGGLGYYESTKDASTNFFFSWLPKGTYVFEYPLFVTHAGDFSNGITSIQCMYAPEFSAHSEGVRIRVEK